MTLGVLRVLNDATVPYKFFAKRLYAPRTASATYRCCRASEDQKRYRKISIYTGEPLLRLERCKNWYDAEYSHCTAAIPDRLRWG
jgi:hypothetical protein